jgi:inhibitor of Bruton tyrosine kinase
MDCSLVSRSDYQQAKLHARYPDLQRRVELERQAKIDSIHVLNKYADAATRAPPSFKAGSFLELSEQPTQQQKSRRPSSRDVHPGSPSPVTSPLLKGKRSVNDLIFDMDEEDDDLEPSTPSKSAVSRPRESFEAVRSLRSDDRDPRSQPLQRLQNTPTVEQAHLGFSPSSSSKSQQRDPVRPWGASPLPSSKLDIKAIMEQASSSRTSSLSLGLSVTSSSDQRLGGSFKMSQKERKRMQQLQGSEPFASPQPAPVVPASSPGNPWQMFPSKSKPLCPSLQTGNVTPPANRTQQLTMRQTLANPSGSGKDKAEPTAPAQRRSISGPAIPISPAGPMTPATRPLVPPQPSSTTPKQPVIQSIRHTPMPERPSPSCGLYSLTDILTEQQAAKDSIRDAAAKRSLQEIQQEQEFQEWWDKESAKVMEEEARRAKQADGKSAGRRRGGRNRGKQKGKGKEKDETKDALGEASKDGAPGPRKGPRNRRPNKGGDTVSASTAPAGSTGNAGKK